MTHGFNTLTPYLNEVIWLAVVLKVLCGQESDKFVVRSSSRCTNHKNHEVSDTPAAKLLHIVNVKMGTAIN